MQGLKSAIWQFFRQDPDGSALLVWPSRIPHWMSKILLALGSYGFLAILEGKTSFKVQSGKNNSVTTDHSCSPICHASVPSQGSLSAWSHTNEGSRSAQHRSIHEESRPMLFLKSVFFILFDNCKMC